MVQPRVSFSSFIFFAVLLFIIGDLYFAYTDKSCTNTTITNTKIGFSLGTWLKISGYTNLLFLLVPIVGFYLVLCSPSLIIAYMVLSMVYVFFRLIWVGLGAIIFWGFLWPHRVCNQGLTVYMWINLISSLVLVGVLCYNQQHIYTTTYVSQRKSVI